MHRAYVVVPIFQDQLATAERAEGTRKAAIRSDKTVASDMVQEYENLLVVGRKEETVIAFSASKWSGGLFIGGESVHACKCHFLELV